MPAGSGSPSHPPGNEDCRPFGKLSRRAPDGPGQEVCFPQEHPPGREAQIDSTHYNSLGVTIGGRSYRHLLFQVMLRHSGWRSAEGGHWRDFLTLKQGLQNALWASGGAPRVIRSGNTSAGPSCRGAAAISARPKITPASSAG